MEINKFYNKNKIDINYKYQLFLKEIIEHKDFSKVLYEIDGFADDKKWGVTERQNIICLDKNDDKYLKKIEFICDSNLDNLQYTSNNDTILHTKNTYDKNKNTAFENFDFFHLKKNKKKKLRKKITKQKKIHKKGKPFVNFHHYFNHSNFYDSSHLKSYVCSCGKKCICVCNSIYCRGDCSCDFYYCSRQCYMYNDHYCGCPYDSGEC